MTDRTIILKTAKKRYKCGEVPLTRDSGGKLKDVNVLEINHFANSLRTALLKLGK